MGKTCLKCKYERQPEDMAPDYECPKCGALYAKVEALKQKKDIVVSVPEEVSAEQENRFIRFVKNHRKTSITITVLCLLVIIGILAEYYMNRSFETQLRRFENNLLMVDKESFEKSLDSLMDIINTSCKRVVRYSSLSADTITKHVLGAMDASRAFIKLMRETANGESLLYDYNVERTTEILYGNLDIIYSHVEGERARAIVSQRLLFMRMSGIDMEKRMAKARNRELLHPRDVTGESEESNKGKKQENQKEAMIDKMTMSALKIQCAKGIKHACEALEDMKNRGNREAAFRHNQHRRWQGWAQMVRERARNINNEYGSSITIQSWDGSFVEITRENVEEVIEEKRPEGSQ